MTRTARRARATPPAWASDPEAAYLLDGWAVLEDLVVPEEQREYREELAWEARQAAATRLRLLTAVSHLPAPDRDVLRAYLTMDLRTDVLAALLRQPEQAFWRCLLAAGATLLPTLAPDLQALLPKPLRAALDGEGQDAVPFRAPAGPLHRGGPGGAGRPTPAAPPTRREVA